MPSGKVRFFDAAKGFGFIAKDEGGDVYVHASALPEGVTSLHPGQRVDFGVIAGRRGEQALSVEILDEPPSVLKARRKKPEQMAVVFEDLLKIMDQTGNSYRHGRYPSPGQAKKLAHMLRAVADELEL
ncbi:cold-shock protein [Propionimicrobium lymphophilum]|uniref:CSD domain-containing protein n=1 Tax=Propionimicrobium lymphophilum ACS-093-V-SCH5 TaxID=883161 RepID=S2WXG8_9ACTN|nr:MULTISPECIES: cold-shock protein [Propionimicrobium]EPD32474.1 hypothetical protein HMPREF9306_02046 [Propionimicrobium lymphophilum ACS-093-V-SCH5]ETJ97019.1 cold-shock DNA-binding domain protein [Propionimicrobium sp. BV2F7]MDK7710454.1 cold-shock protein [Propionimicrobium lymphophilum]MDK7734524.1 cold-shock protein [Propionimicrobium lymphophilum]